MNRAGFKNQNFKSKNSSRKAVPQIWPSAASLFPGAIFAFKYLYNKDKNNGSKQNDKD